MPRPESTDQRGAPAPLLDAHQAAEMLNVPHTWVRAEARAGRLPCVRLGPRYVRFDAEEIAAWWQTQRDGPWRAAR